MKSPALEQKAMNILRDILQRLRDDEQGGYPCYRGEGRWNFASTTLPSVTPQELNTLFTFVGVTPDKVESLGDCENCVHADYHGNSRGWEHPCVSCRMPRMSNFVPLSSLRKKDLRLSARQLLIIENLVNGRWWGTGYVKSDLPYDHPVRQGQMTALSKALTGLQDRGLVHDMKVTNAGRIALKQHYDNEV